MFARDQDADIQLETAPAAHDRKTLAHSNQKIGRWLNLSSGMLESKSFEPQRAQRVRRVRREPRTISPQRTPREKPITEIDGWIETTLTAITAEAAQNPRGKQGDYLKERKERKDGTKDIYHVEMHGRGARASNML